MGGEEQETGPVERGVGSGAGARTIQPGPRQGRAAVLDLTRLSPAQQAVVLAGDGPLLVVAGPGSGKTTTMAARIAYLVRVRCLPPDGVLALTFTASAARTLRARLLPVLGEDASAVAVTTAHALGLRLLRRWPEALGFAPGGPRVCAGGEAAALLQAVAGSRAPDFRGWRTDELVLAVERWRRTCLDEPASDGPASAAVPVRALALAYEDALRRRGAVDYPGLLAWPRLLFRARPDALRACQDAYRAVLVDEAQALCPAQYGLVRCLAGRHGHVLVVGDPRQAVYGWRGADPALLGAFLRDFPAARALRLDDNFRSSGHLVAVANALGRAMGFPVTSQSDRAPGTPAVLREVADEAGEAAFIAAEVGRLNALGRVRAPGDVAVLCRTRQHVEALARGLTGRGLACRLRTRASEPAAGARDPVGDHLGSGTVGDRILLSTIHAAQGGEWPVVFVAGLEEGLLPHARALTPSGRGRPGGPRDHPVHGSPDDPCAALQEELRLFFVAVTRARQHLCLIHCRSRDAGGRPSPRRPSRFLALLPDHLVVRPDSPGRVPRRAWPHT